MAKKKENPLLELSREVIHLFLNKKMDAFLEWLDDNFVWIGDYDALFTRGKEPFAKMTASEAELPPVTITEEEYDLLTEDTETSVTYGRCAAITRLPDMPEWTLTTKFHFTFVWRTSGDKPKLLEAMACHTMDSTLPDEKVTQAKVFKETLHYKRAIGNAEVNENKLRFKGSEKKELLYFYPSEILYIKANKHTSILHIADRDIPVTAAFSALNIPPFLPASRSYLINPNYIRKLIGYKAVMVDGSEIPISRNLYASFRKEFEQDSEKPQAK